MRIFQRIKEQIGDASAYEQGREFAEAWREQGGEDIDEEALRRFHVDNGLETWNWAAFNRGVRSVLDSSKDEE